MQSGIACHLDGNRSELIHIALGNDACSVSSYWMHLQGLAGSQGGDAVSNAPFCDIGNTHTATRFGSSNSVIGSYYYTPRALFVDQPLQVAPSANANSCVAAEQHQNPLQHLQSSSLHRNGFPIEAMNPLGEALNNFNDYGVFDDTISASSFNWDSRYRLPQLSKRRKKQQMHVKVSANGRHVVWDDDEEEEEPDNDCEEGEYGNAHDHSSYGVQRAGDIDMRKKSKLVDLSDVLPPTQQPHQMEATNDLKNEPNRRRESNNWQDLLRLSPFSPDKSCFMVPAKFIGRNNVVHSKDENAVAIAYPGGVDINTTTNRGIAYHQAMSSSDFGSDASIQWKEWKTQLIDDKLRHMLEECDSCQGFVLVNDASFSSNNGSSLFSGLCSSLMQELKDECPSAGKWNITIDSSTSLKQPRNQPTTAFPLSTSQRQSMVQMVVERGLSLYHSVEYANAVLPLKLQRNDNTSDQFDHDILANVAIALETCTLPYRLSPQPSMQSEVDSPLVGLHGSHFYGNYDSNNHFPFGSATHLEFREFLKSLQSQSSTRLRRLWELDAYIPAEQTSGSDVDLWARLQQGTSLERDQRMIQNSRDHALTPPGSWMLDCRNNSSTGGLLSCYSPEAQNLKAMDRSLHHHFALSSSLRPVLTTTSKDCSVKMPSQLTASQQYLSAIMQGMGIGYTPEQSSATIVPQSLGQLLRSSASVPPSSLLKYIRENEDQCPVLTMLGNTTRRYPLLQETAVEFKKTTQPGSASRGYYNRQVGLGLLPEEDDCQEAIESCFEIRDAYLPPGESGFFDDSGNSAVRTRFHDDL